MQRTLLSLWLGALAALAAQTNRFDPLFVLTNPAPREVRFRLTILPVEQVQMECHAIWIGPDRWCIRLADGVTLTNGPIVPGEIVVARDGKRSWHAYFDHGQAIARITDGSVVHLAGSLGDMVNRRAGVGLLASPADRSTSRIVSHSEDVLQFLVKDTYRHRDTVRERFPDGAPRVVVHEFYANDAWQPSFRLDYEQFTWLPGHAAIEFPDTDSLLRGTAHQREVIYDGRGERQRLTPDGRVFFSEPMDFSAQRNRFWVGIAAASFSTMLVLVVVWAIGIAVVAWCQDRNIKQ